MSQKQTSKLGWLEEATPALTARVGVFHLLASGMWPGT